MPLEVLAFQVSATLCCAVTVPDPVSDIDGAFAALVTNATFAEAAPATWGENTTVIGTLCPALRLFGREIPLIENSELLVFAEEIVTGPLLALSVAA